LGKVSETRFDLMRIPVSFSCQSQEGDRPAECLCHPVSQQTPRDTWTGRVASRLFSAISSVTVLVIFSCGTAGLRV